MPESFRLKIRLPMTSLSNTIIIHTPAYAHTFTHTHTHTAHRSHVSLILEVDRITITAQAHRAGIISTMTLTPVNNCSSGRGDIVVFFSKMFFFRNTQTLQLPT